LAAGQSQEDLGRAVGVGKMAMSKFETGSVVPGSARLIDLAEAVGYPSLGSSTPHLRAKCGLSLPAPTPCATDCPELCAGANHYRRAVTSLRSSP
jgi:transcriptional regulator with XRE-family HTH domain